MLLKALTSYGELDWQAAEEHAEKLNVDFDEFQAYTKERIDCGIESIRLDPVAAILEIALSEFDIALYSLTGVSVIEKGVYVYANACCSCYDCTECVNELLNEVISNINNYDIQDLIEFDKNYAYTLFLMNTDNITSRI